MYIGEKPRKGLSKFVAVLTALAIASASLFAVPAYAAESGAENQNPVMEFFGNVADGAAQLFGLGDDGIETYAVGDVVENSAVVDRDSTNDWNNVLSEDGQVSTQNIGRIWTDKSVFTDKYDFQGELAGTSITKAEGSDFLVGLSALSSTSNLKTVTTTTTPLDIVLVLDVSGSMDNGQGDTMGYSYTATYSVQTDRTYYIEINGEYERVQYSRNNGWYYTTGRDRHYVDYKRNANDDAEGRYQFYTRQTVNKMQALQSAANTFVSSVADMNASVTDSDQQHRVSIVKFASDENNNVGNDFTRDDYNCSQVVMDLTGVTSNNVSSIQGTINDLHGEGATRADYGLHQAQRVLTGEGSLTGARTDAKKVVIFFTDGSPTNYQDWNDEVASSAVGYAHSIKGSGATIYSIGVVSGANPDADPTSDYTSNINKFLHAVSSNYKDATYEYEWGMWGGSYQWDLGTRTPAPEGSTEVPQYYYAAEDSAQLDQVFQDITTSISDEAASGSPIEDVTTTEGETNPGNLTFNDELGAYMEVAGETMQIVYADQTFTSETRTSQNIEGGVEYTYPFSGTVHANEAYGDKVASLSGLQIKVTHYDDPAKGDVVEAVIPADLIPMRNYDVDTENGTMTVSSIYPVRLFYSVQVKAEAAEQLADPSSAIYTSNYVANNTNADGTGVEFYSNLYTDSNGDGYVGDTTATFKPSNGNRFYYFTTNTPLYTSNNGDDTQADRSFINGGNTVYYKDTYWVQTDGTVEDPETGELIPAAEEKTEYIPLSTSDIRDSVRYTTSGAYLPAQTHNEDKIDGLYAVKGETGNPTETAGDTLNPTWAGENISARMGNNGRLALELPGTLAVSKNVAFGDNYGNTGFDETVYTEDTEYTINITLTGEDDQPVSGTYKAQVKNAQGAVVSNPTNGYFDITFTNGKATRSIKHGETLYIYGLDAGATYEVTETAPGAGFTTAYDDNAKGTIEINKTSSTTVTNTYTLQSTELTGSTDLKVSKTLSNRDWREGDSFTFQIAAGQSTPNAPMPDKTTVTIDSNNKDKGASFGNISYSTPGQYVYIISEVVPTEDALTGVTYSRARYRVVVNVEDNGKGTMTATSTMTQIMDDAGNNVENGAAIDTHTAAFTNTYRTSDQGGTANIGGTKRFTDATGATTLADWTFDFTLTAVGGYPSDEDPGEPGADGTVYPIDAANVPMPADAQGTSKTVTLSGGAEVFNFGEMTYDGNDVGKTYVYAINEVAGDNDKMTYDGDTEYVTVTVTETQDGDVAVINAVADRNAAGVVFENSYAPESATLNGNTALGGTKTITGRDMLDGESYDFTLAYASGVDGTTPAEEGWVVLPDADGMTASVSGAKKDVEAPFTFGDITFNHVGEYTFTISENVPTDEDARGGMTYDNHTCTVTVDVTYNKNEGRLDASVDYGTFGDRAGNEFVNEYESSFNYGTTTAGGLNVSKTLTGRDMLDGEFSFTITAADVEGNPALTSDKLAEADKNFNNSGANDGVANVMNKLRGITFDQGDAGKTFIYTVAETKGDLPNVDYDANVYTVEIKVIDDNDGTMHTETTVKNAGSEQIGDVVIWDDQATEGNTVATVAFNNTYTPDKAELPEGTDTGLKVTKKVTGAPTDADFTFTLVLTNQPEGSTVGGMDDDGEGNMIANTTVDHNFTAEEVAAGTTAEGLFGTLSFDKAGTYTFEVIENDTQGESAEEYWPAGWKYDTSTRYYTVVVTDENPNYEEGNPDQPLYDGKLYIQSVNPYNQTFTNRYNAEPVVVGPKGDQAVSLSKKVEGTAFDGSFGFTLAQVNPDDEKWSNVEFAEGATEATVSGFNRDETKTATFGNITFKAEGDYEFTVSETKVNDAALPEQDGNGWKYDRDADTVTIRVSKVNPETNEYDGVLHATIEGTASFTNSYAATGTLEGESQLNVTKKVVGAEFDENMSFNFTMKLQSAVAADGQTDISDGLQVEQGDQMVSMPADGIEATITGGEGVTDGQKTVGFGKMTFTKAGTYTFAASENAPDPAEDHWTYDSSEKTITVTVVDNNDGTMKVTPQENYDTTFINIYYNPGEAKSGSVTNPDGSTSDNASAATVGSVIEYKVNWVNTAQDENGKPTVATVVVTDKLPEHTSLVEDSISKGGSYDADTDTITWTFENQPAGAMGTVSFKVTVDESALEDDSVSNMATIGENDPAVETNTVTTNIESGSLEITKTVEVNADQGTAVDANKLFEFTVEFKTAGDNGAELTESYPISGAYNADGEVINTVMSGGKIYLHHGNAATVTGLPEGAVYTVTETEIADDGYTQTAPAVDGKAVAATGTIVKGDAPVQAAFTNAYSATEYEGVPVGFELTKKFTKHAWTADYSFQFKLTGVDEDGHPAPLPKADEDAGVTVDGDAAYKTVAGPQEGGSATFDFGEIEYTKAGVYTYTVTEVEPDHESDEYNPGIDYSSNEATITVTVTDRDQFGASMGALSASASVEKGLFTNEYQTGFITVDAVCGLDVVKNMTGHAIGAGDFTFMMEGADDESTARMNDGNPVEFATAGAALGTGADTNTATETVEPKTGMMFGIEDVGHTYTYNVYEVIPEGAADNSDGTWTLNGVTYDGTQHTVAYDVTENGRGGLLVEVFVDGESCGYVTGSIATLSPTEQPTITFNNSYDAGDITVGGEDGVEFVGGKELANRPLEDGEFTFDVYDANNDWVTSGTNAADGTITFDGITYDMAKLNADKASGAATATTNDDGSTVFEYIYNIVEDQSDFEMDGISTTTPSINVTVQVTDDGKGNLTAQVVTPVEDIQFKNIYGNGEGGTYESNLTGSKLYVDNGLENAPDIEGLYTFTVTVPEGAPEPELMSANNDADGNVDFGVIEFTMDNVFTEADAYDEDGTRTKTFEYVVTESGNVEGVDNDSMDIRTITYTVTDMGDGRLDVQKTPAPDAREGKDFTFTNTYDVDPEDSSLTGDGRFSITKTLNSNTSRTLSDGEFSFTLTDVATGEVVKTAANAADGTVSFPAITFTEPGTYKYTLSEVKGDAPGMTYDGDQYNVTALVEDNGNGTLGVEWSIEGVEPSVPVVFENTYEADPSSITFGALKTLTGRDMVEGEFTFELTDPEGNTITATNTATGSVVFPTVEFTKEGTYEYTVSEVLPKDDDAATEGIQKDGVTYDEKVWTATVTVADNPETGVLEATVDYGNGTKLAEFNNTYTKPAEPPAPKPEEPKPEVIPATGDAAAAAVMATAGIGAALAAAGYVTSKKRGE